MDDRERISQILMMDINEKLNCLDFQKGIVYCVQFHYFTSINQVILPKVIVHNLGCYIKQTKSNYKQVKDSIEGISEQGEKRYKETMDRLETVKGIKETMDLDALNTVSELVKMFKRIKKSIMSFGIPPNIENKDFDLCKISLIYSPDIGDILDFNVYSIIADIDRLLVEMPIGCQFLNIENTIHDIYYKDL